MTAISDLDHIHVASWVAVLDIHVVMQSCMMIFQLRLGATNGAIKTFPIIPCLFFESHMLVSKAKSMVC